MRPLREIIVEKSLLRGVFRVMRDPSSVTRAALQRKPFKGNRVLSRLGQHLLAGPTSRGRSSPKPRVARRHEIDIQAKQKRQGGLKSFKTHRKP